MVTRLLQKFDASDIFISTGKRYGEIIESQLPELPTNNIIVEPEMRDVGPAVGLVTSIFAKINPDESMAILWGDHLVKDDSKFHKLLSIASTVIERMPENIVFLAHTPRFANQNIGWIGYGESALGSIEGMDYFKLNSFKYRPDIELVNQYVNDGHHAWNLGYFVVKPRFLWDQFCKHSPELAKGLSEIQNSYGTTSYDSTIARVYPTLPKVSFDNAVLEKIPVERGVVMVADIGWSDLGAWETLKEALQESPEANVVKGEVLLENCKDSLCFDYQGKRLVIAVDIDDLLVVNTQDVLLVSKKSSAAKIKKIVEGMVGGKYEDLT
jgi:mannose-1-phosphate guanylyltransferase